jgi:hypothetical protein
VKTGQAVIPADGARNIAAKDPAVHDPKPGIFIRSFKETMDGNQSQNRKGRASAPVVSEG